MRHGIDSLKWIRHGLPVGVVVLLSSLFAGGSALADPGERLTPFLRQYAAPQDRPMRQMPAFAAEPMRRSEMDERNPRRWSPEERRQLRRDVHEAGRDVYGNPPRRPD